MAAVKLSLYFDCTQPIPFSLAAAGQGEAVPPPPHPLHCNATQVQRDSAKVGGALITALHTECRMQMHVTVTSPSSRCERPGCHDLPPHGLHGPPPTIPPLQTANSCCVDGRGWGIPVRHAHRRMPRGGGYRTRRGRPKAGWDHTAQQWCLADFRPSFHNHQPSRFGHYHGWGGSGPARTCPSGRS